DTPTIGSLARSRKSGVNTTLRVGSSFEGGLDAEAGPKGSPGGHGGRCQDPREGTAHIDVKISLCVRDSTQCGLRRFFPERLPHVTPILALLVVSTVSRRDPHVVSSPIPAVAHPLAAPPRGAGGSRRSRDPRLDRPGGGRPLEHRGQLGRRRPDG